MGVMLIAVAVAAFLPQPGVEVNHAASSFALADRSSTILALNPLWSPVVLISYAIEGNGVNGPVGSIQPGVAALDVGSGSVFDAHQINVPPHGDFDVATNNAGHDAPVLVSLGNGDVMVAYGAMSTYWAYHPPAGWACLAPKLFCMPSKIVTTVGKNAADITKSLQSSPEFNLPTTGLSEGSFANGDGVTIFAGSEQVATPWGQAGSLGYVAYHPVSPGDGYFDTSAGPWDFHRPLNTAHPALQTLTRLPQDNAYFEFTIQTTSSHGPSTINVSLDGVQCVTRFAADLTAAAIVDQFVAQFNSGPDPGCIALRARYRAVNVLSSASPLPGGKIGIEVRSGDAHLLAAPPHIGEGLLCLGSVVCQDLVDLHLPGVGGHVHFLYGGVFRLQSYFYAIVDVQQVTRSWYGPGHNSLGLALACFRSAGPRGVTWTWTDCAGAHPFTVSPGQPPAFRLGSGATPGDVPSSPYLIGPPIGGYPKDMIPFTYDYSMEAQPQYVARHGGPHVWPIVSALAAVADNDGNLWIAYQCFDSGGKPAICYLEVDHGTGKTVRVGFIDKSTSPRLSLGSLEFLHNVARGLVLGFLVGNGEGWGCGPGPCAIVYRADPAKVAWAKIVVRSFGGRSFASATGTIGQDFDATHLLFQTYKYAGEPGLAIYSYAP